MISNLTRVGSYKVTTPKGNKELIELYQSSREGTDSPVTYLLKYNNRLITSYERQVRGWKLSFDEWSGLVYSELVKETIFTNSSIFTKISKSSSWSGTQVKHVGALL